MKTTLRICGQLAAMILVAMAMAQPPNDSCPGFAITSLPYTYDGNNTGGITDYEIQCDGPWMYSDVVFTMTLPLGHQVTASLCAGTSFNAQLAVFYGGECPGNNLAGCSSNACGAGYQRGSVTFNAVANTPYFIVVAGGNPPSNGPYRLTVTATEFPPTNDTCPGTLIAYFPFADSGSTAYAVNDYDFQCFANISDTNDVVYRLAPSANCREITASLCGSSYNTVLNVRSGATCPGDVAVACNDNYCDNQSRVRFTALGGTNYYLIVDGGFAVGNYVLNVTGTVPVPFNDTCPGTAFTSLPFTASGSTSCAMNDYDITSPGAVDTNEVVYQMTLPECKLVTASLCGADWNTQLIVQRDGPCPGNTMVAYNDDACGTASRVSFGAIAGVTYYILVDGAGETGPFTLNVTGVDWPFPGDACPGEDITTLPYNRSDHTNCYANDYTYTCGAVVAQGGDQIYHLSFAECHEITVYLSCYDFDGMLFVRSGSTCPGDYPVDCTNNDFGSISFVARGGYNYYLIVDGATGGGMYGLQVVGTPLATPPNDVCPGTLISSVPFADSGNTGCATNDYNFACPAANHREVVYTLNLPQAREVTASLCGSDYNTMMLVRTGGECPGSTGVVCNDDFCGSQSQVTFNAAANTNYYILVDGVGQVGNYQLSVTAPAPENDQCPGIDITSFPFVYDGSNINAGTDYSLACTATGVNDVVFRYQHSDNCYRLIQASLCTGTAINGQVYVRAGATCPGDAVVACNDTSCAGQRGTVQFYAAPDVPYYILVAGRSGSSLPAGSYRLTVDRFTGEFPPPNDACPGTLIPSFPFTAYGSTACAQDNYLVGSYDDGREVLYQFITTGCTEVIASLCGSGYNTYLTGRTADGACPGTAMVVNDDACSGPYGSYWDFFMRGTGTYWLQVGGHSDSDFGSYVLNVNGIPWSGGTGCPWTWIPELPYSNHGHTMCNLSNNTGMICGPDTTHRYNVYGLSVTQCRQVVATMTAADNPMLIVRTDGSCPGSTVIACRSEWPGTVTFTAEAGQSYYLVAGLEGWNGGEYDLSVNSTPCGPPPTVAGLVIMRAPVGNALLLSWPPSPGASGYYIYRGETLNFPLDEAHRIASVSATSYTDAGTLNDPVSKRFYVVTAFAN